MNLKRIFMVGLALLLIIGSAWAVPSASEDVRLPGNGKIIVPGHAASLDEQCSIDYIGLQNTSNGEEGGHGDVNYPDGGSFDGNYGAMCFLTTCGDNETLYAYCVDIQHTLFGRQYCVNVENAIVNPLYPEQYPAAGWLETNYPVTDALTDDILQLALWKLSNNENAGPDFGVPWYHINDGRGWPLLTDLPAYPYVNTLYGTNVFRNDSANSLVRWALGASDGIAKNVILCDDELLVSYEPGIVTEGNLVSDVTVTLSRGPQAIAAGNTSLSGVWIWVTANNGTVSPAGGYTDSDGELHLTLTQTFNGEIDASLYICSRGVWPQTITPCETEQHQTQLLTQKLTTADACTVCTRIFVPSDDDLAVNLNSFTATAGNGFVSLNWNTASENNNASFKMMRNGTLIQNIAATNNATGSSYSWTDNAVINGTLYNYTLIAVDITGIEDVLATVNSTPRVGANGTAIEYNLVQNFPNPFNPETNIRFSIAESGMTSLKIYDANGREVSTLISENLSAGEHSVTFNGVNLPSGIYFYKLTSGAFSSTKKMILMK